MVRRFRFGLLACAFLLPAGAAASAQPRTPPDQADPPLVSVHAGTGITRPLGDMQSLAVGFTVAEHLTLLFGYERQDRPTRVERYPDGFSATRGSTQDLGMFEARLGWRVQPKLSVSGSMGLGAGRHRGRIDDLFPRPQTSVVRAVAFGGGIAVPVTQHVSITVDARAMLVIERDVPLLSVPLRAGVACGF